MDQGCSFQYDASSYPRYRYFQQRLQRLLPRWQRIMEADNLPDCIPQGREKMKTLINSAHKITNTVTVNVFTDEKISAAAKVKLQVESKKTHLKKDSVTLEDTLLDIQKSSEYSTFTPCVTIFVMTSDDFSLSMKGLESKLSQLLEEAKFSFFIHFEDTNTTFPYLDLADASFDLKNVHYTEPDAIERIKQLPKQIQFVLEMKVIIVLEQIAAYIEVFVPKTKDETVDSLHDAIFLKLMKGLKDPFVVKDLSPNVNGPSDDNAKTPADVSDTEKDKMFQEKLIEYIEKKTKCIVIDIISKKYGMSSSLLNEFMNEGFWKYGSKVRTTLQKAGLPKWPRDKSDDGVKTCKVFSYKCASSINTLISDTESYLKNKYKNLKIVQRLQFELFGLLEQSSVPQTIAIPEIPELPVELQSRLLEIPEVYGCGTLWGELVLHVLQPLTPNKINEVKSLMVEQSYLHDFSTQLVELCREQANSTQIEHGLSIRARKLRKDARALVRNEDTHTRSRADTAEYDYGTLGCFVNIQPSETTESASPNTDMLYGVTCAHCLIDCEEHVEIRENKNNAEEYSTLGRKEHDIYRPHALDIATVKVEKDTERKCQTGLKDSQGEMPFIPQWSFYDKNPLRKSVYKIGSATNLTRGTCISNDYKIKPTKIMEQWNTKIKEKDGNELLDADYNVLISSEADVDKSTHLEGIPRGRYEEENVARDDQHENQEAQNIVENAFQELEKGASGGTNVKPAVEGENGRPFSEKGDSGAVVCDDDPDTLTVCAISLLEGSLWEPEDKSLNKPAKYLYSYSTLLTKTVEQLEHKYSCRIKPAF